MDATYAQHYRDLYERHWWWRARETMILGQLEKIKPASGFGPILDIGCGDGLFFERLEAFGEPEGLEPEADVVSEENRQRWTFHLCPFDERFEPGKQYGLILMLDVLEHLPDALAALRHVVRLLAPGGKFIVTVPAFKLLWTKHDDLNLHQVRYTRASLAQVARQAGLRIQSMQYFFNWLFPVKLLVRLKERSFGGEPEVPKVPAPLFNRTFYGLSRIEQRSWGKLPLPFGSSLLAVFEHQQPAPRTARTPAK